MKGLFCIKSQWVSPKFIEFIGVSYRNYKYIWRSSNKNIQNKNLQTPTEKVQKTSESAAEDQKVWQNPLNWTLAVTGPSMVFITSWLSWEDFANLGSREWRKLFCVWGPSVSPRQGPQTFHRGVDHQFRHVSGHTLHGRQVWTFQSV